MIIVTKKLEFINLHARAIYRNFTKSDMEYIMCKGDT